MEPLASTLEDARQKLAKFREHYNQQRPHSSLASDARGVRSVAQGKG